jgi:8-oxo-dGTP pyrophosphatase MutT (NUDIX family)
MKRIGVIAAGGESRRTGLGEYTSKAALPLRGKSLLAHQIDFLRRSDFDGAFVIARCEHVGLLSRILSADDRAFVSFIASDCGTGWAGEVERAMHFVDDDDEVLLVSCDNDHAACTAGPLWRGSGFFTYTSWHRTDRSPTDGTVLAQMDSGWRVRDARCFKGNFFSGYVSIRGLWLKQLFAALPVTDGKKELTTLLAAMSAEGCAIVPYQGNYEDVSDLRSLALLNAGKSCWSDERVDVGAGVLLYEDYGHKRVLLTERQDGLGWTIPGGHVDSGEACAHAAARELNEEIGIDASNRGELRLLGVYPCTGKTGNPAVSVIFHARVKIAGMHCFRPDKREVNQVAEFTHEETKALTIPFNLRAAVDDWFAGRELDVR